MADILKGAPVAEAIAEGLTARAAKLRAQGIEPCLAVLRVGAQDGDLSYEHAIFGHYDQVGIRVMPVLLPAECTQAALTAEIEKINADPRIHGCIMFRPLPRQLDEQAAAGTLIPCKDVDCMTPASLLTVLTGRGDGFAPCTAQSCMELLDYYGIDPAGKRIAVIGRSLVIGKPVSMMLQARNATVTMCHSKTVDLPGVCRQADILIVAVGRAGMVDAGFVNPNQVVIDVGINTAPEGGICGDVLFEEVEPLVKAISPVPGGVGVVTAAVLCKHVIEAAEKATE